MQGLLVQLRVALITRVPKVYLILTVDTVHLGISFFEDVTLSVYKQALTHLPQGVRIMSLSICRHYHQHLQQRLNENLSLFRPQADGL